MLSIVHDPVVVRVPAKVNLHLGVDDTRAEGHRGVTTVYQALSLWDTVAAVPSRELAVRMRGEGQRDVPAGADNLAWRAAEALAEHAGREPAVRITIDKTIPVGGGMGGGCADAAATLVALDAMWGLGLAREELAAVAAGLGGDAPFALYGGTALGSGRREELTTVLSRNACHWVLAFAKGGLRTSDVFAELGRLRARAGAAAGAPGDAPASRGPAAGDSARAVMPGAGSADAVLRALAAGDAHALAAELGNDLQAAALSLRPDLRRTLHAGRRAGALRGIVSGSGPTCAFLCEDADAAVAVSLELAGEGVCRTVRTASGPVPGARVAEDGPGGGDDDTEELA